MEDMEQLEFYKVFYAAESATRLLIPVWFMKEIMKEEEEGCARLVGPNGAKVPVVISKENNYWFFKEGWNNFVKDNSIQDMDGMIFTYVGAMKFSVKLFLPNGLRKLTEGCVCHNFAASSHVARKIPRGKPKRKRGTKEIKRSRGQIHVMTPKEQDVAATMSTNRPFLVRTLIWGPGKFPVMNIPTRFLNEHGLTLNPNQEIGLCNNSGRRWVVKMNKNKGALSMGKGFPLFLRENCAGNGNTLVYEVIDPPVHGNPCSLLSLTRQELKLFLLQH